MSLPSINIVPPSATGSAFELPRTTPMATTASASAGPSGVDEKRLLTLTYGDLLTLLTDPFSSTITYASLTWLLTDRIPAFLNPSSPFGSPTPASRAQVETLSVRGLALSKAERDFILKFSTTWDVDEIQCALLWTRYTAASGVRALLHPQEHTHGLLQFLLEEQLNTTRVVAALLRAASNDADAVHGVAAELLPAIFNPYEEHLRKLLTAFQDRCTKPLPTAVQSKEHRPLAPLLARHALQEQIGFLELLFLANYIQPSSAALTHDILHTVYHTQLGTAHAPLDPHLMDDAGLALTKSVRVASILLAVGVLNLESLWDAELALSEQAGTSLLTNPDILLSIQETLLQTPSDSSYAPVVLAWAVLLHALTETMLAAEAIPDIWLPLVRAIAPEAEKGPAVMLPDRRMAFEEFASVALDPAMSLFPRLEEILSLPPFDAESERGGASLLSPVNALAYRSVLKGLLLSVPTLIQLPFLADLDAYLSCFCTLLARGPAQEVSRLALQFWENDMRDPQRSTVLAIPAARAPLSFSILLRLLTALCGNGNVQGGAGPAEPEVSSSPLDPEQSAQQTCADYVWRWFGKRRQFAMLLNAAEIGILWEAGPAGWETKKPMSFPGGGIIERDAVGQILNQGDGREGVVVSWPVQWNGLHLLLDLLKAFIQKHARGSLRRGTVPQTPEERRKARIVNIDLSEVQVEVGGDETELIGGVLELMAALLRAKPALAEEMDTLFGPLEKTPHPFLELVIKLLELVLIRTNPRSPPPLRLITPLLTILSSAAYSPTMSVRLAAYLRSSGVFAVGGAFARLVSSEQILGTYFGTLDIIRLVTAVADDARRHQFATPEPDTHVLKAEVLQQAVTFLFRDIWSSFLGWRYTSLTERLVLAEKMMDVHLGILQDWALAPISATNESLYRPVVYTVTTTLLSNQSAITPLTAILTSAPDTMANMAKAKRTTERDQLCDVVERALCLMRASLLHKGQVQINGLSALENAIFSLGSEPRRSLRSRPATTGMAQLLFDYVTTPYPSSTVQLEAANTLYVVCRSSSNIPSTPSFVGSLNDAVETVKRLVEDILENDMVPVSLRRAVWDFASATIDTKQAIGSIFLTGSLPIGLAMSAKARGKQSEKGGAAPPASAVSAALAILNDWEKPSENDFSLVAAALNFLDVCWRQFEQYSDILNQHRKDGKLWKTLTTIATSDIGSDPGVEKFSLHHTIAKAYRSSAHEEIAQHSDRLLVKAHSVHLLSLDIAVASDQLPADQPRTSPPDSFKDLEAVLRQSTILNGVLSKAIESPYSPAFMAGVVRDLKPFDRFDADLLRCPPSSEDRQGGDDYLYSLEEVFTKLRGYPLDGTQIALALKRACALNLTWSLIDRHVALTRSWQALLEAASPWIAAQPTLRPALISSIASIARVIADEQRDGDTMVAVHATRVALLQAMTGGIIHLTGLPTTAQLYALTGSLHKLVLHEQFPMFGSFRGILTPPFHRPLLHVVQWCGRLLATRDLVKTRTTQQWVLVAATMSFTLMFLANALRKVFVDALAKPTEAPPHEDLELLITLFDRCTQDALHPAAAVWLAYCEDTDLIRLSLEVLALSDMGGASSDPTRHLLHPEYANYVLALHMVLSKTPVAAESLARAGVLSVYTENSLTPALEAGAVIPNNPNTSGRSLAHDAWCQMLSVTTALMGINSLTSDVLDAKILMLVQSYGRQLSGTLAWRVEDTFGLPLFEELERTVAFFYTMSVRSSKEQDPSSPYWVILSVYSEKALGLLQQLNYAVTHPNNTFSLLDPFSHEEEAFFFQEQEQMNVSKSSSDMIDPVNRPALAALMQRLFLITRDIMSSMTALSRPDAVIRSTNVDDWWVPGKIHAPTISAAVSIDEPASIGTLLELANVARDTLSALVPLSGSAALPGKPLPPCTASFPAFDKVVCTSALRETLEMLLLYITAEIMRGIYGGAEASAGAGAGEEDAGSRRAGAASSDPAQRALRGELLSELRELLSKSAALFEKMDGAGTTGNIASGLSGQVQKRLGSASA
ncbi:hypothetical protein CALVIDRAFT_595657 [Calocera viscosa TUFC12733]|uniref:Nucleoporin Nup188 N-terminal subdomain III domain-containing protein n=1 Tax=Calocera viscosa (strain TUFC12733) TaxID=1330018 RepID=A0A167QVF7_CALVF|nr:hypothetical protein CALVIDRAFT_595657 [Calocera viscosa TUFC12733]